MDKNTQHLQHSPQLPPQFLANQIQNNDEIDLRELFLALWKGKLIIIATTAVFMIAAVVYALNAQQWWSSKATVAKPQSSDFSAYRVQVKQFQPIFDVYQDDGTVLVSGALDYLISPSALFQQFVTEFNSANNKRAFLDNSIEFQAFREKLDADADADADASRKLYAEWFKKITASAVDKKDKDGPYTLNLQATTKQSSFTLINEYINVIKNKTLDNALENLESLVDAQQHELAQQKRILEAQAQNRLNIEIERAEYSLEIAKAASVTQPIQTNTDQSMFSIDLGYKAIEAKINALKSIKNLSVIEPRLQQVDAKLAMLSTLSIDPNIEFQTFRFLEDVEQPITRDKPKRALIAVLGTLLGGMLGVAIVLVRHAFRKEDDVEKK
ncbi:Wzz/FepE/Etk N-terminal domain-containing protein [Vibrio sp. ZSDZ34]|uniref:Wzz/FepE/Etk N-terminal domain-containing protein n=1 Tax=Vibrio gelatinilyticus TaxID=2893468 RepID=A0A9X2AXP9_9VIBR|nr:Wzz/FepE/Etk N-terminal domain-containing protein [Vibrio gelatinilyticus]MCJ2378625.1 Wzz/FepE/Etk N-terminal domain-containing protein [Vibrio gelatinilyticus]